MKEAPRLVETEPGSGLYVLEGLQRNPEEEEKVIRQIQEDIKKLKEEDDRTRA